jgi:glycosyltransferase involved in cell wall biosynthesis
MRISIVTPSLNAKRYVRLCVESVRVACAGLDYEHVVVDGLSTDGTLDYLQAQTDIRLIVAKDGGMYEALNRGIAAASGQIIAHLNTDEQFNPAGLREAVALLVADSTLGAVFGSTVMVNGRLEFMQLFNQIVVPQVVDTHWCMPVQTCSLLYRKSVWERSPFDTQYRLAGDHAWFRRQMELGLKLARTQVPIGIFMWHGENLSSQNPSKDPDVLADIDRGSLKIQAAKKWYRLKKLLLGGYWRSPLEYEFVGETGRQVVRVERPALKLPKFDKMAKT